MSPADAPQASPGDSRLLVLSLPDSPDDLTPVLMDLFGLNRIDARIQLHRLPGLLPETLTQEQAEAAAQAIHAVGGYAVRIAAADIPDLRHPEQIHHLRMPDDALEIVGLKGDVQETIPTKDLELFSIGAVPLEMSHRENIDTMTVVHSAPGPKGSSVDMPAMRGAEAWLIAENPFRCYRINHGEMNYEYLGERKTESATTNFRLFADDLIAHAPGMYLTPSTRAFTGHGLFRHYAFDSHEELQNHTLFHLLIRRQMHR